MDRHFRQHAVHRRITRATRAQRVKAGFQRHLPRHLRLLAIRLQFLVQLPDTLTHAGNRLAVLFTEGHQAGQRSLGVQPARGMHQDVELRRPVADDYQLRRHPVRRQAAQQRPLRGDAHAACAAHATRRQMGLPGRPRGEHAYVSR